MGTAMQSQNRKRRGLRVSLVVAGVVLAVWIAVDLISGEILRHRAAAPLPSVVPSAPVAVEPLPVASGDWPWWRGPNRDGKSLDGAAPLRWSPNENIVWQAQVPGRGHSSPIVVGDRIFVTTADESEKTQSLIAFDRQSGAKLWTTTIHRGGFMAINAKNSHASATPACDGQRVFAAFINSGALWVSAVSIGGKLLWQTDVGRFHSEHGYGSSPALYGSLVIVNGDSRGSGFIAAVDRVSGALLWRTPREGNPQHGSYATPIAAELAGRTQVVLTGLERVAGYDPGTGRLLWSCDGPTTVMANTPVCTESMVFASGGYPDRELLCIRADGSGDVTSSHVVWRTRQGVSYVPSPLVHEGRLYVVKDDGIVSCFDALTGTSLWQRRLGGAFSASPVLAGEHMYVPNEAGTTYVFKIAPEFELAAQNDLGDGGFASPAICGGQIFLRTSHRLYCIGESTHRQP
jgi:outer membrane protein assembly factor BamB